MSMQSSGYILSAEAMRKFTDLRGEAIAAVTARFYDFFPAAYEQFGEAGRKGCAEDMGFHLDFMRPALETGLVEPLRDYLRWIENVLESRKIPAEHLGVAMEWLAEFCASRLPQEDASKLLALIAATRVALRDPAPEHPPYFRHMPKPWPQTGPFREALVAGDHRRARKIFSESIAAGHGFCETEMHLMQAALYQIGVLWQKNQVTVAQEHLATAICHSIMAGEFAHTEVAEEGNFKAVMACLEGNHHTVGLRMVSDALELSGWEVMFLGANTPIRALMDMVRESQPHLVGISVSLPYHLRTAREAIDTIRATFGKDSPAILIGGLSINQFDGVAEMIGADAYSPDAASAVRIADFLVTA